MYIFFKEINAVLTCEKFPSVLPVDEMKKENLEYLCNKWEKTIISSDGKFTLSYKLFSSSCDCDNSDYTKCSDFKEYDCYNCGRLKFKKEEETICYLQNSGTMDCVWTNPTKKITDSFSLIEVEQNSNIYQWVPFDNNFIFALHVDGETNLLSDSNMLSDKSKDKNFYKIPS